MAPTRREVCAGTFLPPSQGTSPAINKLRPTIPRTKPIRKTMARNSQKKPTVCQWTSASKSRAPARLALLDAGSGGGEHLGRAATIVGIKGRPEPQHHCQVFGREQFRHEVDFFH